MTMLGRGHRRGLRRGGAVVTALYVCLLSWLAVAAASPTALEAVPGWLAALADPGSAWAMTLAVGLGVCGFLLFMGARRLDSIRAPLVASLWAAASALPLAIAAYLPCSGASPAGWQALTSTLVLFVGNFDEPFGRGRVCSYSVPLALHVARLAALTATLTSVLSAVAVMSRAQLDRLKLMRAKSLAAVVGVDDESVGVVEALARQAGRRRRYRTVVLTKDVDRACVRRAWASGALVVRVDLDDPEELPSLKLWSKVDRAYLLSQDFGANQERAESLRRFLAESAERDNTASGRRLPIVVRVDDPWLADEWRRRSVGDPNFAIDAIAVYEETADTLVQRLLAPDVAVHHVIVVGTGPLALALLAELSQRGREQQFVGVGRLLPEVTLVDVDAADYVDDHRHRQKRFVFDPLVIHPLDDFPTLEPLTARIDNLVAGGVPEGAVAVVVGLEDSRLGTRLALRHRGVLIFELAPGTAAIPEYPLFANLRPFSLALSEPRGKADDCWERAAMAVHERYRHRYPDAPLAVAWDALPREFYRQSNRRQVRTTLDSVKAIGRTWQPTSPEDRRSDEQAMADDSATVRIKAGLELFGLTPDELEELALREHVSWCRHYRADGWTPGARDDDAKRHPNLLAWAELAESDRSKTRAGVIDTLFQLRALGYRSEPER